MTDRDDIDSIRLNHYLYAADPDVQRALDDPQWCACAHPWTPDWTWVAATALVTAGFIAVIALLGLGWLLEENR